MTTISTRQRVLGGLIGSLVGDAVGVPVEFMSRSEVQRNPVQGMRAYGTHHQPAGTWSDDSALLLASCDSLNQSEDLDLQDMGQKFCNWHDKGHYSANGDVFDIGGTTHMALSRIQRGTPALSAGGTSESSNGNGSIMRILPVAICFAHLSNDQLAQRVRSASCITHAHPRSQLACEFLAFAVRYLLEGDTPADAWASACKDFWKEGGTTFSKQETAHFIPVSSPEFPSTPEHKIRSGGYVIDTLEASLWCLLNTDNFKDCVLKGVNLASDSDTTGCVAGGLAGVVYGVNAIPEEWLEAVHSRPGYNATARIVADFVNKVEDAREAASESAGDPAQLNGAMFGV